MDAVGGWNEGNRKAWSYRRGAIEKMPDEPQQYQPLFDANPCPMWAYEERTLTVLAANEAALSLYGYSREAFLALSLPQICPPVSSLSRETGRPSVSSGCHMKKGGVSIAVEAIETPFTLRRTKARLVVVRSAAEPGLQPPSLSPAGQPLNLNLPKDGPQVLLEPGGVPVLDAQGNFPGNQQISRDIIRLARVEEVLRRSHDELEARVLERTAEIQASNDALRDSEEKYRQLFATIADAVLVFDAETRRFLEANSAAVRLYGYTHEELLTLTYTDLLVDPEASMPSIAVALGGAVARIPLRYHRKKDRTIFPVEICGSAFLLGGRRVLCGIIRDITARQQAEETLRNSEQELADFFGESPLGLLWVGPDGAILKVNRAELELVGRRERELLGHHVAELHADADAATDLLGRLAKAETVRNFRARIRLRNGSIRHVLIDANSRWDQSRLLHSRWFVRDITRRVELEHEILTISEQEQRRLGHDLHDDLCQQLAGIMFLCQSLAKELGPRSPAKRAKAAEISRMLQQVMLQTREMARGLSPVDLEAEGLMGALSQLASHTTKVFGRDCVFCCESPVLVLDQAVASHLYRIAQEAVGNAVKHSKCSRIEVALKADGRAILLSITDDGVGLRRQPSRHSGMGMRIMRYRASVIGGSLAVSRNAEGGTTVRCSVPNRLIPRRKMISP